MGEQSSKAVMDLAAEVASGVTSTAGIAQFRTLAEANGYRMGAGGWIRVNSGSQAVQGWRKLAELVANGKIVMRTVQEAAERRRDENRGMYGTILEMEIEAYAEAARRRKVAAAVERERAERTGTVVRRLDELSSDRCVTPGHVHVHPDTIRTDNGCTLLGRTVAPPARLCCPPTESGRHTAGCASDEAHVERMRAARAAALDAMPATVDQHDGFKVGDIVQWAGSFRHAHRWRIETIYVPTDHRAPYAGLLDIDDKGIGELRTAGGLRFLRKVHPPTVPLPATFGVRINLTPTSTLVIQNDEHEVPLPGHPGLSVQLFGIPAESITGLPRLAAGVDQREDAHDEFLGKLLQHVDDSWESTEGAAESIVLDYVAAITARLRALVGEAGLARYPEDADGAPLPDAATEPAAYRMAVWGMEL